MFSLGMTEIVLLCVIALIVLGPDQIPELARTVARLLNEWKRATSSLTDSIQTTIREDLVKPLEEKRAENSESAETPSKPSASTVKPPEGSASNEP